MAHRLGVDLAISLQSPQTLVITQLESKRSSPTPMACMPLGKEINDARVDITDIARDRAVSRSFCSRASAYASSRASCVNPDAACQKNLHEELVGPNSWSSRRLAECAFKARPKRSISSSIAQMFWSALSIAVWIAAASEGEGVYELRSSGYGENGTDVVSNTEKPQLGHLEFSISTVRTTASAWFILGSKPFTTIWTVGNTVADLALSLGASAQLLDIPPFQREWSTRIDGTYHPGFSKVGEYINEKNMCRFATTSW
ncbi:hypothetical protein DFH06DRAFT_1120914 [Mycena polygramma]|nr:hypothetical protein DFH06DRAFT_1120914 [Mycena polygramma]